MLRQTVKVEVYVWEVVPVVSNVLILTKKEPRRMMYLMRHASKKIQNLDEQMILLLSQVSWVGMLGTTLDYLAHLGPPAIIIEVFPRNETDETQFSKFHFKRIPSDG